MKKLTFKQYLESKNKLRETVKELPQSKSSYTVSKYCRLVIGEKDDKKVLLLKPNQKIIVEWDNVLDSEQPNVSSIVFENVDKIGNGQFSTYWSGGKLLKWLEKNCKN